MRASTSPASSFGGRPKRTAERFAFASCESCSFSCAELGAIDLRRDPLEERKGTLQNLLRKVTDPGVQFNEHIIGDGAIIFEHACKLGFEEIVSKHREHPYRSGPSKSWVKIKNPNAPGVLRFKDDEP